MPEWFSEHLAPDKLKAYAVLFTVVSIGSVAIEKVSVTAKNQPLMRAQIQQGRLECERRHTEVMVRIAMLEGQAKDKNEALRAVSNQATQNSIYINAINGGK